ncbi:hypothetical protein [Pseudomonas poae]|uniref:hypothetical protein n=1 Tax=Pseudomonas poae TaxID=200451 RepID=UPI0011B09A3A|nr:hypothetical protein [Pseudomonas poae]
MLEAKRGGGVYCLAELSDFNRAISLLEMPIERAKQVLGVDFSYDGVIAAGLRHDSDYWISLAISWVINSSAHEVVAHVDDLKGISIDSRVSQKNRHLAKKALRRLSET